MLSAFSANEQCNLLLKPELKSCRELYLDILVLLAVLVLHQHLLVVLVVQTQVVLVVHRGLEEFFSEKNPNSTASSVSLVEVLVVRSEVVVVVHRPEIEVAGALGRRCRH